jgi:Zn-dependent peptidase ImmA (M78 family)
MVNRDDLPDVAASGKPRREIDTIAEAIAKQYSLIPGAPIEPIVSALGGQIRYLGPESWDAEDGSLYVFGERNFEIAISAYTGARRDRFTIAHELGHYVIHSDYGKKRLKAARVGSNRCEWEANWFAAALLMPRVEFTRACTELRDDPVLLASRYLVSPKAAEIRRDWLKQA